MVQSNIQRFVEGLVVSTRFIFIAASAKKVLDRIRTACVTVLVRPALRSVVTMTILGEIYAYLVDLKQKSCLLHVYRSRPSLPASPCRSCVESVFMNE